MACVYFYFWGKKHKVIGARSKKVWQHKMSPGECLFPRMCTGKRSALVEKTSTLFPSSETGKLVGLDDHSVYMALSSLVAKAKSKRSIYDLFAVAQRSHSCSWERLREAVLDL